MEAGSGKFRREETRVLKEKILDDGGAAYEVWARNPKLATYIGLDGHTPWPSGVCPQLADNPSFVLC